MPNTSRTLNINTNIQNKGWWHLLFLCLLASYSLPSLAVDTVTISKQQTITNAQNKYYQSLIKLVMDKSQHKFGPYKIQTTKLDIPQKRSVQMLAENKRLSLIWTMTSLEREKKLLAIHFPLLKGLLGHRVFIINRKDTHKFQNISSLNDMKSLKAGQGAGWPDTEILKHNGLRVIESRDYQQLFLMLKANRYDYFPRGITEAWDELNNLKDDSLIVEPTLLLRYQAPIYFFVNKTNQRLHDRLTYGLQQASKDGSFDTLFNQQEMFQKSIQQAKLDQRTIIDLQNPNLLNQNISHHFIPISPKRNKAE